MKAFDLLQSLTGRSRSSCTWGDGFSSDSFSASLSMTQWDQCSLDEYAFYFPKLMLADRAFPLQLLEHLAEVVAIRFRRLAFLSPDVRLPQLRSSVPTWSKEEYSNWFEARHGVAAVLRTWGMSPDFSAQNEKEHRLIYLLDTILHRLQQGILPVWSANHEVWFAFGSGINPGYLWGESAISPIRGYTAAWLGHLDRGRTAFVPEAVAEYLLGSVLEGAPSPDREVMEMVNDTASARRLKVVALRRLAGEDPSVSLASRPYGPSTPVNANSSKFPTKQPYALNRA